MNDIMELQFWLWLHEVIGATNRQCKELLEWKGSPTVLMQLGARELLSLLDMPPDTMVRLEARDMRKPQEILRRCEALSVRPLPLWSSEYPQRLRDISDPPAVLYVRGTLPDLNNLPSFAVVGPRNATAYGLLHAERLAFQLSRSGACVISGMAIGVDTAAHRGALTGGMPTVAVFGTAIDRCYPASNRPLLEEILKTGAAVSEYYPGRASKPYCFPQRNRIISGLSLGIVVTEAAKGSGSLITAGSAMDQGREVFAVPGMLGIPSGEGSNALLADGGKLVRDARDILAPFRNEFHFRLLTETELTYLPVQTVAPEIPVSPPGEKTPEPKQTSAPKRAVHRPEASKPAPAPKPPVMPKTPPPAPAAPEREALKPEEEAVLAALDHAMTPDELSRCSGFPVYQLLAKLTLLELAGYVRQLPGHRFERI